MNVRALIWKVKYKNKETVFENRLLFIRVINLEETLVRRIDIYCYSAILSACTQIK